MILTPSLLLSYLFLLSFSGCYVVSQNYFEEFQKVFNIEEISLKILDSLKDVPGGSAVALQMFDASTKIPSGILDGNYFDLGDFDECYNIQLGELYGKYCLGTLLVDSPIRTKLVENTTRNLGQDFAVHPRLINMGPQYTGIHIALCVPHTWKVEEEIPGYISYHEELCYSKAKEEDLSAGAITTIAILSVFGALVITSTLFDVHLYYKDKKTPHELFLAFSVLTNGRKLFSTTVNSDQLLCLNGIKAISLMWVILAHEYAQAVDAPLSNFPYITELLDDPGYMFIKGATIAVDTFLLVAGLVTVYTFLKTREKGAKFNLLLFYLHRYLRLTPALGIMALISIFLLKHVSNGPMWKVVDVFIVKPSEEAWWRTILYITNYVNVEECLPQTWYLSVDMQLFVLSPIVLIPLANWPTIGLSVLGVLGLAGVVVPFSVAYGENLGSMLSDQRGQNIIYKQTYARFGPYVIGMALGYFIYKIKQSGWKLRLPFTQKALLIGTLWIIGLVGLAACLYGGYDVIVTSTPDRWENSLYTGFNRNCWALALSIVIFLCISGYGGPVNSFLSWSVFQFLTKLSYSMYLVHVLVITVRYSVMRSQYKFTTLTTMHSFWSDYMITMFLSLILCLTFESPVIIIEKYLFRRGVSKHTEKKPQA